MHRIYFDANEGDERGHLVVRAELPPLEARALLNSILIIMFPQWWKPRGGKGGALCGATRDAAPRPAAGSAVRRRLTTVASTGRSLAASLCPSSRRD